MSKVIADIDIVDGTNGIHLPPLVPGDGTLLFRPRRPDWHASGTTLRQAR